MWPFPSDILKEAFLRSMEAVGQSPGGLAYIACLGIVWLIFLWPKYGWHGVRDRTWKTLRETVFYGVIAFIPIFLLESVTVVGGVWRQARQNSPPKVLVAPPPSYAFEKGIRPIRAGFPKPVLKVNFKISPLLTVARRDAITRNLDAYYRFLTDVGFELPKEVPPLGFLASNFITAGGALQGTVYDSQILVPAASADDPEVFRVGYSSWAFSYLFRSDPSDPRADFFRTSAFLYSCYFRSSYDNRNRCNFPDDPHTNWTGALWDIRLKHGRKFADAMLYYAYRTRENRFPNESGFDTFFKDRLLNGTVVADNSPATIQSVTLILAKRGLAPK